MTTAGRAEASWRGVALEPGETVLFEFRPSFRGNALNYVIFVVGMIVIVGTPATLELVAGVATAALVHYALHARTAWAVSDRRLLARPGFFRRARSLALRDVRALEPRHPPLAGIFATAQLLVTDHAGASLLIWRQSDPEALRARLQPLTATKRRASKRKQPRTDQRSTP